MKKDTGKSETMITESRRGKENEKVKREIVE